MSDATTRSRGTSAASHVTAAPPRSRMRIGFATALLALYSVVVLVVTLSPIPVDDGLSGPIDKVLSILHARGLPEAFGYGELEFTANIVMFIPLGFFLGILFGRLWWIGLLVVPLASGLIEGAQSLFLDARFASVRDIVANSVGGYIGLLSAAVLIGLVHDRDEKVVARALWDARSGRGRRP